MPSKSQARRLKATKGSRPIQLAGSSSSTQTSCSQTASRPTSIVFRSVVTGKTWDLFVPLLPPTWPSLSSQPSATFLLRACGFSTSNVSHEDHLNMGWNHDVRSPYISFSSDLHWAIYYQLKQEHIHKNICSLDRHLYVLEILAEDVQEPSVTGARAKSNAKSAKEVLGTLQVRVVRKLLLMDLIPAQLRVSSLQWFSEVKTHGINTGVGAKYPFTGWKNEMRRACAKELDAIERAVDAWKVKAPEVQPQGTFPVFSADKKSLTKSTTAPPLPRAPPPFSSLSLPTDSPREAASASTNHARVSIASTKASNSSSPILITETTPLLGTRNHPRIDPPPDTVRRQAQATPTHTSLRITTDCIDYSFPHLDTGSNQYPAQRPSHAQSTLFSRQHSLPNEPVRRSVWQWVGTKFWEMPSWMWDGVKQLVCGSEMRTEGASFA